MATLPPPDVAMDISSPSHRVDQDDDIEIDISDYPIAFELTDDEQMVDGELARPDTATDENMDDDEPINIIPEEVMTDEPQLDNTNTGNDFDDELIDYDDDQAHQNLAVMTFPDSSQTVVPNNAEAFSQVPPHESIPVPDIAPAIQRVDDNLTSITTGLSDAVVAPVVTQDSASLEHAAPSHPSAEHDKTIPVHVVDVHENKSTVVVGESVAGVGEAGRPAVSPAVADKEVTLAQQQQPTEDEAAAQDQQAEADETEAQRQQQHLGKDDASAQQQQQFDRIEELAEQQQSAEDDNPQPSSQKLSESAAEAGVSATDVLPSPTDTGLHPIMVKYRSTEFPLFKSRMALNGLLENDNIVNVSLSELMATCREQLGINTGEKISDDQELCLKIDHMRSSLREHEPRAFEFSLQDVLDTFVLLHQNDGTKDMPAMWLTIELTWNFSKLLKDMRTAAADGYGMSNFEYVTSTMNPMRNMPMNSRRMKWQIASSTAKIKTTVNLNLMTREKMAQVSAMVLALVKMKLGKARLTQSPMNHRGLRRVTESPQNIRWLSLMPTTAAPTIKNHVMQSRILLCRSIQKARRLRALSLVQLRLGTLMIPLTRQATQK
jgi:hypothetical protein